MPHQFLASNRVDLISRCIEKVTRRPKRTTTQQQLKNGISLLFDQLMRKLVDEQRNEDGTSVQISGSWREDAAPWPEMELAAAAHGKALLHLEYSVEQVMQDYEAICQAITEMAFERYAPFNIDEYRTLNRCLDNAIADAVSQLSVQGGTVIKVQQGVHDNEQIAFLMHELHDAHSIATIAIAALELGRMPLTGATGLVLKRSLAAMDHLISNFMAEVAAKAVGRWQLQILSVAAFIADVKNGAELVANMQDCRFTFTDIDPTLGIVINRDLLLTVLMNFLHNAFMSTHQHNEVTLGAYATGDRILIDVKDLYGGWAHGNAEKMFTPLNQCSDDKTRLSFDLFIAQKSVEADGGHLRVRDLPNTGCIFTIDLPRFVLA